MMIQELQKSATVIDHQHLVEDHPKTYHEQYSRARNKESKKMSGEGTANGACTSAS
jgi:hypothetical protein